MPSLARGVVRPELIDYEATLVVATERALYETWQRLLGEALGEYSRLERQGFTETEVAERLAHFLDGLSDQPEQDEARAASTIAYNEGRGLALLDAKRTGEAEYVVRSELLDSNTCDVCAGLDGIVVEIGSEDFEALAPPALCEGSERCRGFYVPLPTGVEG